MLISFVNTSGIRYTYQGNVCQEAIMSKSLNPSAIRSREMIIQALLLLMESKRYESITISEIVYEAQLVRKTFYRHFVNKDAVLNEYVNLLFSQYISLLKSSNCHSVYQSAVVYFEFWSNNIAFLKVLQKNDLLHFILNKYDELLPLVNKMFPCKKTANSIEQEYSISYSTGVYWNILCKWIDRDFIESPTEMARIYESIVLHSIIYE